MADLSKKVADLDIGTKRNELVSPKSKKALQERFSQLTAKDNIEQAEFFLKSFVFALGDGWKDVVSLCDTFSQYCDNVAEKHDLDPVQAADFLQKQGRTRTATQRKEELKDIDLDQDGRICLLEYLLLHYKVMILKEFFKRNQMEPTVSLDNDGVGLTGVGGMCLEELFETPTGISKEILDAIDAFMEKKHAREAHVKALQEKAALGGVKGLAANNELIQLENEDKTEMNRVEITLAAAKRRGSSGSEELVRKKAQEEADKKAKEQESRNKLKQRAAMFENK